MAEGWRNKKVEKKSRRNGYTWKLRGVFIFFSPSPEKKHLAEVVKETESNPREKVPFKGEIFEGCAKSRMNVNGFFGRKVSFYFVFKPTHSSFPHPPIRCKFKSKISIELNETSQKIPLHLIHLIKTGSKELKLWMNLWNMLEYLWVIVCDKLINFPHEHTWDNFRITFFSVNEFA